jgi:hypothetical protein
MRQVVHEPRRRDFISCGLTGAQTPRQCVAVKERDYDVARILFEWEAVAKFRVKLLCIAAFLEPAVEFLHVGARSNFLEEILADSRPP